MLGGCFVSGLVPISPARRARSRATRRPTVIHVILKPMAIKGKQITAFRLDVEALEAMRRLRRRDGISFSEQARRALRPWLESKGVLKWAADATGKTMPVRGNKRKDRMMAMPTSRDVVLYKVDFHAPIPLRGWVVFRANQQEFVEQDEQQAVRRACGIAATEGVRCFRMDEYEYWPVDCGSV